MLRIAISGSIGLVLFYLTYKFVLTTYIFVFLLAFTACWLYFLCMIGFVKANYRLRGETPA